MDTVAIKTSLPHAPLAAQQQQLMLQQPQQQQLLQLQQTAPNATGPAINAKNNIGAFFQTCKVRQKPNNAKRHFRT